ncbi:MAG: fumarylacetoacetate hydrolase family protein [Myxococcales bacterium]|nr:fumarylacetoacetate hydrolase family protein [Myxococcales bacterium]
MRLATLRDGSRDGVLALISPDGTQLVRVELHIPEARTLQAALDQWDAVAPKLKALHDAFAEGEFVGEAFDASMLHAPLPRAYEWIDGSAYLNHVRLVRKARGAEPPATLETDPLIYQGGSGVLLGPTDDIFVADPRWGADFEGEVAVILGDTPQGVSADEASRYIKLLVIVNDVTLRNLIPDELAKGFGFFQSKPASAFSPFAITPDELGAAWQGGRVHLRLRVEHNGVLVGDPEAGPEMHFSFFDLIAHIAKTRSFTAGTLVGSGTVSNEDPARGISCIAERRTRETLEGKKDLTPFLQAGDRVTLAMLGPGGRNLFGTIAQRVVATR